MKPPELVREPARAWPAALERRKSPRTGRASALDPRMRTVDTGACKLHVYEAGDADRPAVLFLHGFPDCHRVWSHQLDSLSHELHTIAFDLRGCGLSGRATGTDAYLIENLLPDIEAVIDAVRGPQGKVHLVGHDWGSVLGWSFVSHPAYAHRVLSWSSISGVHAGLVRPTLRSQWRRGGRHAWAVTGQLLRSWYAMALSLPGVGDAWVRRGGARALKAALMRGGVARDDAYLSMDDEEARRRAAASVALYRQNLRRLPEAPAAHSIAAPVQLIVPVHDSFLRPVAYEGLSRYCRHLERWDIAANHWVQRSHHEDVTVLLRAFIQRQAQAPSSLSATGFRFSRELAGAR